ncbi:unnamed protein product [Rhizophagus irregularis]|nr:unnamed protein product [Rhizophagus irregularis]
MLLSYTSSVASEQKWFLSYTKTLKEFDFLYVSASSPSKKYITLCKFLHETLQRIRPLISHAQKKDLVRTLVKRSTSCRSSNSYQIHLEFSNNPVPPAFMPSTFMPDVYQDVDDYNPDDLPDMALDPVI